MVADIFDTIGQNLYDRNDTAVAGGVQNALNAEGEHQPQVVGMSALLTTTMVQMKTTIEALEEAKLCGSVKITNGGASVTEAVARETGAAAYAPDAASAVDVARKLSG